MSRHHTVRLEADGDYWAARWTDTTGKRRKKMLGRKDQLSKRQARKLCDRLAAEMAANPARADIGKAPHLGEWIERFIQQKAGLKPSSEKSYRLAGRYLTVYFGETYPLDRITKARVADWHAALTRGQISIGNNAHSDAPSESTVCNYCRHAKAIFGAAVKQDVLAQNPFAGLPTEPKRIKDRNAYVSRDDLKKLCKACPNVGWQALLALQRLGGLRLGEALGLTWLAVDWDKRIITVTASKTGQTRRVPMDPELYRIMLSAFDAAETGESLVIPARYLCRTSNSTLHRTFKRIIGKAQLKPWPDLFQTLRRNAAQDFRQMFRDPWVVTSIMGHSEAVERKYYLGEVSEEDLARVTGEASRDPRLQEIMEAWPTLPDRIRGLLRAIVRRAQSAT